MANFRKLIAPCLATFFYLLPVFVLACDASPAPDTSTLPQWAQLVNRFIEAFAKRILDLAVVVTSIGVASMALIETTKNIFPSIHRNFHRNRIRFYLAQLFRRKPKKLLGFIPWFQKRSDLWLNEEETFEKAWEDMILLAAAGNEKALFNLPAEQIIGQIGAAARVALDYPDKYPDFFRLLTAHVLQAEELELLKKTRDETKDQEQREHDEARYRAFPLVQRKLDATLIAIKDEWTWWNRLSAVGLSIVLMLLTLGVSGNLRDDRSLGFYLIAAILGGFVAPVAKDLVASLERFRRK